MSYRIAAIDIHKSVLMVVVATAANEVEDSIGELLDQQIQALDRLMAQELKKQEEAIVRVAEIPGFGVDSAQQLLAEVGVEAETFSSAAQFSSWVGICPGSNVSAEDNKSSRSPKGNRFVRRILTQSAQAAVKKNGSHFQSAFRRFLPRLGFKAAIWAIAHQSGRVVWKILHDRVAYIERGSEPTPQAKKQRARKLAKLCASWVTALRLPRQLL